jgi:Arc/MetJ-type ribon-helix-helix transcriptional regulator
MAITLDAATEERIQRQLNRGAFREPAELLAHALDLIEAENPYEDWLLRNKEAIQAALERTSAQAARGESYSPEECRAMLAQHRAARTARAA